MPPFPLIALAIASFGIGTTEFVIMGMLPEVATDLRVDVPTAGMLVSGYAISVALGSPLVAMATAHLPRKTTLLGLMGIFILGNLGCALAPGYLSLMAARIVTALAHGAFFGVGSVVAATLVAREKRAQAVSLMFAGLTLANVLGVPLGTAIGQLAGWRTTFWAVTGLGVLAMAAIAVALPSRADGEGGNLLRELNALRQWRVILPMLISLTASVSLFSVFTYIAPLLRHVTGLAPHQVTWVLLLFGVGLTCGNWLGGRLADWRFVPTIIGSFVAIALVLAAFATTSHAMIPAVITVTIWGVLAFALVSPLQIWVLDSAVDAPNLASTLNQSAFNMGNATGAWLGGVAIAGGVGYAHLPLLGAAVAVVGLALTLAATAHRQRAHA